MRGMIISGTLFALVVIFCIYSGARLEKVGGETSVVIEEIQNDVENEKWEEALLKTQSLQEKWEKDVKWITVLIDHRETDEINQTLSALCEYVYYRETPELMATASSLKQMFEHIPLKERLIIENVF